MTQAIASILGLIVLVYIACIVAAVKLGDWLIRLVFKE